MSARNQKRQSQLRRRLRRQAQREERERDQQQGTDHQQQQQETRSGDCVAEIEFELCRMDDDGGCTTPSAFYAEQSDSKKDSIESIDDSSNVAKFDPKPIPSFTVFHERDRKPVVNLDKIDTDDGQAKSQISTFQVLHPLRGQDESPLPDVSKLNSSAFVGDLTYEDIRNTQKAVNADWAGSKYPTHLTHEDLKRIKKTRRLEPNEIILENAYRMMSNPKTIVQGSALFLKLEDKNEQHRRQQEAMLRKQFPATAPAGCLPDSEKAANVNIQIQNTAGASATVNGKEPPAQVRTEWVIRMPHNRRGPKL